MNSERPMPKHLIIEMVNLKVRKNSKGGKRGGKVIYKGTLIFLHTICRPEGSVVWYFGSDEGEKHATKDTLPSKIIMLN